MLSKFRRVQGEKGFTFVELLIVIAIIGILAAIAVPQWANYKSRGYQLDAKDSLQSIYTACKAYWKANASTDACTTATAKEFGWAALSGVTVEIADGTEAGFTATSTHASETAMKHTINSSGNIS